MKYERMLQNFLITFTTKDMARKVTYAYGLEAALRAAECIKQDGGRVVSIIERYEIKIIDDNEEA